MSDTYQDSELRALLSHTALCFALASGLGFIGGGLAGLDIKPFVALSAIANYGIAFICIALSFAILWCSAEGPPRWRPFVISRELAESLFGGAASFIVLGGVVALIAQWM
ncbi:MAG TPA: hypothetical protein VFC56_11090 [Stellaceae bacterium]|nr:hypothetical protein [Stellaceae bacterium]